MQTVQQVEQTPRNMTASQRIIFPLDGSPQSSKCGGDSDTDISLWEDASSAGQLNEALQLLSGPPGALQDLPSPLPEAVSEPWSCSYYYDWICSYYYDWSCPYYYVWSCPYY